MALYSFKGHYPVEQIDNNKGWYEVPAKPEAPEGKEVRWENAEWVVRDPKPEDRPGYQWNWNHGEMAWVECEYPQTAEVVEPVEPVEPVDPGTVSPAVPSLSFSSVSMATLSPSLSFSFPPPMPDDGKQYSWDDATQSWIEAPQS